MFLFTIWHLNSSPSFVPHACADVFPRCWFWPSTVVIKLRRPKIPLYPANPRPNPFNFITTRPKPHYILLIRRSRQYCSFLMGIFQTFAIGMPQELPAEEARFDCCFIHYAYRHAEAAKLNWLFLTFLCLFCLNTTGIVYINCNTFL
jgi:hypothetical protein